MKEWLNRAALVLACVALAACSKNALTGGGAGVTHHVLRFSDAEDLQNLNPVISTQSNLGWLSQMTMAYLVRYGNDNKPIPELATVVPTQKNGGISADGKTITWHLRRGVKWSDGQPFNADDVVFTTNAVNNPRNNVPGHDGWNLITKIDEPDKYTVVFHMKKPYSSFLPTFFGSAGANPCVLPKHILGGLPDINHAPYNSLPVGIGPFKYQSWTRGDSVVLVRNPYYWRGQPKLERVVFKILPDRNTVFTQLQTGEIDMWVFPGYGYYDRLKALSGVRTFTTPGYYFDHVDFNIAHAPLKDPAVRQALRLATDRTVLNEKISHGLGILQDSIYSPADEYIDRSIEFARFDIAKANALLDSSGWKRGSDGVREKNGVRLALEFATSTGAPDTDERIELIRNWWKQIGVSLGVKHYLPSLLFAPIQDGGILNAGKYDVATFSWGFDPSQDLSPAYECSQIPPNGQNNVRWCNAAADAAFERFKRQYDPPLRAGDARIVQQQMNADVPIVVLDYRRNLYAVSDALKNYDPNAATPFDDMMNVDI
ncbi:MAG: ABC transporter substrate-binding protein [Vulcanimicrobiaceae bacterium]